MMSIRERIRKAKASLYTKQSRIAHCALCIGILCIAGCANMGSPDGGRYDEEPPYVVGALPADRSVNNSQKKIKIQFNEYIKLENASEKVTISPPQIEMPEIAAEGKKVVVKLQDSLKTDVTYTIDFSDAISDNNEGNPMGNYTYSFSTGNRIDTLEVSGAVLMAENLEPVKGIMVGLYSTNDTLPPDSLFACRPFDRVGRTNGSGHFCIKGIAPGIYRVFALQDMDGNYYFSQKSEMLAFDSIIVEPYCKPDIRIDSVFKYVNDERVFDSLAHVPYTHFFPDDIVLNAFLEGGQAHYRLKEERPDPLKFKLYFTAPADTLPEIRGLNFDAADAFIIESNPTLDTLQYWIRDTTTAYLDTLAFAMTYLMTDTLGQLVPCTDTLELVPKETRKKQLEELEKQLKDWEKQQKKNKKRQGDDYKEEPCPALERWLEAKFSPSSSIGPDENVTLEFAEPIDSIDSIAVHLQLKQDSLWPDAPFIFDRIDSRRFRLYAEWRPQEEFRLIIDSAGVHSLYGIANKKIEHKIQVKSLDEYGSLFIVLKDADTTAVVQLLDKSDKAVRQQRVDKDGHADFFYLKPGDYYMRCYFDTNGNGKWDTGDFAARRRPEEVFYFPKPMNVRAKWEMEQDWNPRSIARMEQKPLDITKQKPDKEKKVKNRNAERAKQWKKGGKKSTGNQPADT